MSFGFPTNSSSPWDLYSRSSSNAQGENQTQREVEVEQQLEVQQQPPPLAIPEPEKPWNPQVNYFANLEWLTPSSFNDTPLANEVDDFSPDVKLYALSDVVGSSEHKAVKDAFKGGIWCSENYIGANQTFHAENVVTPFTVRQTPGHSALVVKRGEDNYSVGLIDQQEADFWCQTLQNPNQGNVQIALYDLGLRTIVSGRGISNQELKNSDSFQFNSARLNFIRCSVTFSKNETNRIEQWLIDNNPQLMQKFFLAMNHGVAHYSGSPLEALFNRLKEPDN